MDKSTIIHLFLKSGAQINSDALEILLKKPQVLEKVLQGDKSNLPTVITTDFLESLSHDIENSDQVTVSDLTQVLSYRYNFVRDILLNRFELVNLVSINKIGDKLKQFSVIGIVFEKDDVLTLEDQTGQGEFEVDKELVKYIVEDEVIGAVCERVKNMNKIIQIVYPDIPLNRETKNTKTRQEYIFISNLNTTQQHPDVTYCKNFLDWAKNNNNIKIIISGRANDIEYYAKILSDIPSNIEFHQELSKIKIEDMDIILMDNKILKNYMALWNTTIEETIINLLKKRNLNPILGPESYNNTFLLDTIPDVIIVGDVEKPSATNYKGITIAINGNLIREPIYWIINLQTREALKINFS